MTTDVAEKPNPLPTPPAQHGARGVAAHQAAPGEPLQTSHGPVQPPAPATQHTAGLVAEVRPAPAPPLAPAAPSPAPPQPGVHRYFTIMSDADPAGPLKMLVYGTYGSGKTYLAATANQVPAMRDVLYLDVEGGARTIAGMGLDRIQCPDMQTLNWIKEWLIRHAQLRDSGNVAGLAQWASQVSGQVPAVPKQYRTVIIDSLSEMATLKMLELSGVKVGTSALDGQINSLEGEDWGKLSSSVGLLIRTFRDLPYNVIFVASAVEKQDELKRRYYQPNFNGKMAKDVQGFADCVFYLTVQHNEAGQSQRVLALAPGRNFDAKHRFTGCTTTQIINPSMADIFALHTGGKS